MQQWTNTEAESVPDNTAVPFHQAFCGCLKVPPSYVLIPGMANERIVFHMVNLIQGVPKYDMGPHGLL